MPPDRCGESLRVTLHESLLAMASVCPLAVLAYTRLRTILQHTFRSPVPLVPLCSQTRHECQQGKVSPVFFCFPWQSHSPNYGVGGHRASKEQWNRVFAPRSFVLHVSSRGVSLRLPMWAPGEAAQTTCPDSPSLSYHGPFGRLATANNIYMFKTFLRAVLSL